MCTLLYITLYELIFNCKAGSQENAKEQMTLIEKGSQVFWFVLVTYHRMR